MLSDGFFDPSRPYSIVPGGDLPHWRQDGALYFVTFRLRDSLPQGKLDELRRERQSWPEDRDLSELVLAQRRRIERWLDGGSGSCLFNSREMRAIVEGGIRHFEGVRYELGDFVVAANHVHALVRTATGIDLSEVVRSWMRYSSLELEQRFGVRSVRGLEAGVWQSEPFDHIVRSQASLERISRYIRAHIQ